MQFSMQIKHFFCIYPCILVVFFIVRHLLEYPALPDERAARSVIPGISGRARSPFRPFHCGAWKALLSAAMVTGYEVPGK